MTSELLRRAREYERERLPEVPFGLLPAFHLTGGVGWINDPNGFSVYRGEYHLFFQYYPFGTYWSSMHWGHAKTKDFIRWERLPCAMAPDEPYDGYGCFSGSAAELPDGRQLLMYTAVRKERREDGSENELQTQCLAFGDGIDYEKYAGNPVISAAELPPGGSARDFRDPKIWRENGRYYAVVGNRCPDGTGAILLYESENVLRWQYRGTLAASADRRGRMWECPDFFALDGRHVLLTSPQEMRADEPEFIQGNTTLCLIGQYDRERVRLETEHEQTIDYGLDFYAPQTLLAPDGRRIMIAWMQFWDSVDWHPPELPFFGQMTLPRELRIRNGRLYQTPVRELETYRSAKKEYRSLILSGETELEGVRGRCVDMIVSIRPETESGLDTLSIHVAAGGSFDTEIRYSPIRHTILVDRSRSGFPPHIRSTREFPVSAEDGTVTLRVILDRWSMELFVNHGERAASFTLYTPQEADGIRFHARGTARIDVEKYDLEMEHE